MLRRRGRRTSAVALAALAVLTAGCGANRQQLLFRQDSRLQVVSPADRAHVKTPVVLRWTIRDFVVAPPAPGPADEKRGYFAVFVDRPPVRPGQSLKAVAKGDISCEQDPSCPDVDYLALHQVYTTTQTSLRLQTVQPLNNDDAVEQLHEAVIVLLDTQGRRLGESAWLTSFKLRRSHQ